MFKTYDWPNNFDGPGFDTASERWKEFDKVRTTAQEPRRKLAELKQVQAFMKQSYGQHADRVRNGIWDNDINKPAKEVAELEEQLEEMKEATQKDNRRIEEAEKELEGLESEEFEIEKVWKKHLQENTDYIMNNYNWFKGDGKQYAKEDEMRKIETDMEALKDRIRNVQAQPKTAMQAINRQ